MRDPSETMQGALGGAPSVAGTDRHVSAAIRPVPLSVAIDLLTGRSERVPAGAEVG